MSHSTILILSVLLASIAAAAARAPVPADRALWPGEKWEQFDYVIEGEKKKGTCRVLTLDIGGGGKMELVRITKGKFLMGSPRDENDRGGDEDQHEVEITREFYLGRYLVTQAQYKAVTGESPSRFKGDKLPVEEVSWEDASAFCNALSKKSGQKISLPTEAQWEYACRAGTKTPFYFGSMLSGDLANCNGKEPYGTKTKGAFREQTTRVGFYPANPWGLYDMSGNVWQWCQDWYGPYTTLEETRDPIQLKPRDNDKILRGGSWYYIAANCRSAHRCRIDLGCRDNNFGFRVVVSPGQ